MKPPEKDALARAATSALLEAQAARAIFPPFNSRHEAYAVLLEEVDELWAEVRANNHEDARTEAIQVAAMALRFIAEFPEFDGDGGEAASKGERE